MNHYIIIIVVSIIFLFFITNHFVLSQKEHFIKLKSGILCGQAFDICRLNQNNVSSCCPGYYCGTQLGHFRSKICIPIKNIANTISLKNLTNDPRDIIDIALETPSESDLNQVANANMDS
jgi:hypothetical protein